ncbi:ABC transporter permease [Sutcliffiella halmapala]|uniref:ABC transporter permease n=1 Tax=Sutcliffiella halmapala TaxID=79882 RepID=UPI000995683E|nr:ABC transporter permease [Sutcliffiella halmapala]
MFLAIKELSQSKLKYILVGLIMVAILFLLFFINGLASGLSNADSSSLKNLPADYIVMNKDAEGNITKSEINEQDTSEINQIIDQKNATPFTIKLSSVKKENKKADVVYFAVNTKNISLPPVIEGKKIEELKNNEVIVNESVKNEGYTLYDVLVDENLNIEFKIVGFTQNQTYSHLPVIYTNLAYWEEMNLLPLNTNNAILYIGEKEIITGFDTFTKDEVVQAMPGYKETQASLTMMKVFLFFISAFVSTVFFYVITIQKTNQFGILKAIGANTGYIAKSIILQVVIITIASLGLSLLAIFAMTQVLPADMPFVLSVSLVAWTGVIFLFLNLIGSIISVFKVYKADALDAIGRVE